MTSKKITCFTDLKLDDILSIIAILKYIDCNSLTIIVGEGSQDQLNLKLDLIYYLINILKKKYTNCNFLILKGFSFPNGFSGSKNNDELINYHNNIHCINYSINKEHEFSKRGYEFPKHNNIVNLNIITKEIINSDFVMMLKPPHELIGLNIKFKKPELYYLNEIQDETYVETINKMFLGKKIQIKKYPILGAEEIENLSKEDERIYSLIKNIL